MLFEMNLNASTATLGCESRSSLPIFKAGRHFEAVSLNHLSENHLSHRLCFCVPFTSLQTSGFLFSSRTFTFSDNKSLWYELGHSHGR